MSDLDLDRLESLVARMERLGVSVTPTSVDAGGYPGQVASGELIESAWGNAVSSTIYGIRSRLIQSPVNPVDSFKRIIHQQGNAVVMTDAGGLAIITYPYWFGSVPTVVAIPGDYNTPLRLLVTHDNSTGYQWVGRCLDAAGAPVANSSVRIFWAATGLRNED